MDVRVARCIRHPRFDVLDKINDCMVDEKSFGRHSELPSWVSSLLVTSGMRDVPRINSASATTAQQLGFSNHVSATTLQQPRLSNQTTTLQQPKPTLASATKPQQPKLAYQNPTPSDKYMHSLISHVISFGF